jgi:PAS domain S-box-containing protein
MFMHLNNVFQRFYRNTRSSTPLRYCIAFSAVASAVVLNSLLPPLHDSPFLLFFGAIVFISFWAGRRPALLGIALSTLILDFFFIPPFYSFSMGLPQFVQLGTFVLVLLWTNSLVERRKEDDADLEIIFQQSLNLLAVCGFDGYFKRINPAWERTLGISCEKLLSAPFTTILHPDDLAATMAEVEKLACGLTSMSIANRLRTADGSYRWILWNGTPSDDGLVFCVTGHDITERKETEAAWQLAKEAAEQSSCAKSEFLANMSHEIRTPMTAILGFAERLMHLNRTREDEIEAVAAIHRNGNHLLAVINDILDISKIESGRLLIERIPCSPCQILSDVASSMRIRALEKSLSFSAECPEQVPASIQSDPTRLRQILMNLVGNAIKFTSAGGVRVSMRLEHDPRAEAQMLRFDVTDTGIGISSAQHAAVFQPFAQADSSTTRLYGGSGLGLAISKRLAEMLDGSISLESAPGQGSTFTLRINPGDLHGVPLVRCDCDARLAPARGVTPQCAAPLGGRILLVEDGRDNRRLIGLQLKEAGAEVVFAENGREALQAIETQSFDVVLMDMQMPVMDGYLATSELRRRGSKLPIIAITAHAMESDRDKCLQCGCSDFLSKPIDEQCLVSTLRRYLPSSGPADEDSHPALPREPQAPPAVSTGVVGPLRSTLRESARMQSAIGLYVNDLPSAVAELLAHLEKRNAAAVRHVVHNLKGSAGGYGFPAITALAQEIEQQLSHDELLDSVVAQVQELVQLVRRVEDYERAAEDLSHANDTDH